MNAVEVPQTEYYTRTLQVTYSDGAKKYYAVHVEEEIELDFPRMNEAVEIEFTSSEEYDNYETLIRITTPLPMLKKLEMWSVTMLYEDLLHLTGLEQLISTIEITQPGLYVIEPLVNFTECRFVFSGNGPFYADFTAIQEPLNIHSANRVEYIAANNIYRISGEFGVIEADIECVVGDSHGTVLGSVRYLQSKQVTVTTRAIYGEVNIPRFKSANS